MVITLYVLLDSTTSIELLNTLISLFGKRLQSGGILMYKK
jgi:hypothetical protein